MIERKLLSNIKKRLFKGKIIILLGARQVGKTTLLNQVVKDQKNVRWLNADDEDVRTLFDTPSSSFLKKEFAEVNILVIDEAQRIADVAYLLQDSWSSKNDYEFIASSG